MLSLNVEYNYHWIYSRYEVLKVDEIPGMLKSSVERRKRISELPAPTDIPGLQRVLGDEQGEDFAIFNHNRESGVETLFTGRRCTSSQRYKR